MMLSDADLRLALADGSLIVRPFHDSCIRASGLGLHLGSRLLKPISGKVVDVRRKIVPDYEEILITLDKPYALKPSEFILAHTFEEVTVGPNLGFLIEGRSTLARCGLTVVQTAMIVDAGHRNRVVTLELANHGPNSILLYPKMKIARAAVFELRTPTQMPYDDQGKYQCQNTVGPPILLREFIEEEPEPY